MRQLKDALLREYGSFADKRIKNPDKGSRFIVDDRQRRDVASDGSLYGYFCSIFAEVLDAETVLVSLTNNVPQGPPVTAWAHATGIAANEQRTEITVGRNTIGLLTSLAQAFRAIVSPGAPRYATANYKYVCPRTADSLDRLARALGQAWAG